MNNLKQPALSNPRIQPTFLRSGLIFFKWTQNRGIPYVLLGLDPENDNHVIYVRNTNIRNDGGLRRNCNIYKENAQVFSGNLFLPRVKRIVADRTLNIGKIRESYPELLEITTRQRLLAYFQSPDQDIRAVSRNYTL
jgi:hypothetical protein